MPPRNRVGAGASAATTRDRLRPQRSAGTATERNLSPFPRHGNGAETRGAHHSPLDRGVVLPAAVGVRGGRLHPAVLAGLDLPLLVPLGDRRPPAAHVGAAAAP